MGLSSFTFLWWAPKDASFCNRVHIGHSRSSKVADFGTNRKGVCNFLLVINSSLTLILSCTVSEIRRVIGWKLRIFPTPLSFNALARDEPFRISWWIIFYPENKSPWAISWWRFRNPSLRRFHSVPACDRQTDGQTDGFPIIASTGLAATLTPCKRITNFFLLTLNVISRLFGSRSVIKLCTER